MDINYQNNKLNEQYFLYKTLYSVFGAFRYKNALHVNKKGKHWSIL